MQYNVATEEIEDTREGLAHIRSNIDVWNSIGDLFKPAFGPYGRDKLFFEDSKLLITNDGATIMRRLNIQNPIGLLLKNISISQDIEAGDGTTSVIILATGIASKLLPFIEEKYPIDNIIRIIDNVESYIEKWLNSLVITYKTEFLNKVAEAALNSKVIKAEKKKYSEIIVDAVTSVKDPDDAICFGIKKIKGGLTTELIDGVAFKKCFTYAGYEQQPKDISNPKILCLNIELEWKAERDNAILRISNTTEYQKMVDAEWKIITDKLDIIRDTGVNVVLSCLAIGDIATQYFARHGIFCAGRVDRGDLDRVVYACGGRIITGLDFISTSIGQCESFEERQVGKERYNFLRGVDKKVVTILLRGPGDEILNEIERSVHDALCVVNKARKSEQVVTGGGSVEMALSCLLRKETGGKEDNFIYGAIAQGIETIPFVLAQNFGLDPIGALQILRKKHHQNNPTYGINLERKYADMIEENIFEPLLVKKNMFKVALTAVSLLLRCDSSLVAQKLD